MSMAWTSASGFLAVSGTYACTNAAAAKQTHAYNANVTAPMDAKRDGKIKSDNAPEAKSAAVTNAMADLLARMEKISETTIQ